MTLETTESNKLTPPPVSHYNVWVMVLEANTAQKYSAVLGFQQRCRWRASLGKPRGESEVWITASLWNVLLGAGFTCNVVLLLSHMKDLLTLEHKKKTRPRAGPHPTLGHLSHTFQHGDTDASHFIFPRTNCQLRHKQATFPQQRADRQDKAVHPWECSSPRTSR